jgi:non-heme chloroperoxidase
MRYSCVLQVVLAISLTACGSSAPSPGNEDPSVLHERTVEIKDGITIHYLEKGEPDGKAVVFLHGYTYSHVSYERNLDLIPSNYHVFAIDQRGHGDSSKPECCFMLNDFATDVVAFLDAVGVPKATLVGHSMGSFIAQIVAIDAPTRVEALVLIGSAPTTANNQGVIDLRASVDSLMDPVSEEFARQFQMGLYYEPLPQEFFEKLVQESQKAPARVWRGALDGLLADDHTAKLSQIQVPTLILWGDHDGIFTQAQQDELASAIPNVKLVVYEQTGHGAHAERPDRFNTDLGGFLDAQ